ncbi:MAG: SCP2 sterol-binding domain-containing protein [Burkholderiales bacterium]|nr:MAG: SCP2 sterol-binding domain-containing protein [Burkholderiales bacterium]
MMHIPELSLPRALAAAGERLPQWPHSIALATALNAAIRLKLIDGDELSALEGRVVRIRVTDAGASASVERRDGRFRAASGQAKADVVFSARATAYLQIATRQQDPDTLFFHRRLMIEGDTELGLIVKNLLDAIEWPRFLQGPEAAGR